MRRSTLALAAAVASTAALAAPPGGGARNADLMARMFPWVVDEARVPDTCRSLLDAGELGRAAPGLLVYLDGGQGPAVVDSRGVRDLVGRLAAPRSGRPTVSVLSRDAGRMTLEARDVGGADGGRLQCWFVAAGQQWRLTSVVIVTPQVTPR